MSSTCLFLSAYGHHAVPSDAFHAQRRRGTAIPSSRVQAAAKKAAAKAEEEKRSQRRWIMQYMEDQSESEDEQQQVSAAGLSWAEPGMYCAPWLRGQAGAASV